MSRLPVISVEEMDERQRPIYDKIISGKRGRERFSAPFNVWIHSPGFLERLEKVGSYLRGDTPLAPRLIEMAVLITARFWTAHYAWYAHVPYALRGGLDKEIISAIAERRRPENMKADEIALYDYCTDLHEKHAVSDAVYRAALDQFGEQGMVDLTGLIGHYTMVSMTLNAFEVPLPAGVEPSLSA
jgi:4-carboxymuconolactone decarboxylase